jgi:hypothetical protein
MTSRWPTDLEPDGTAPVSIALVASGDEHLMRQAMYQLQAGTQLQDRGFTLEGFQVPLVGKMIRITVPIAATAPAGQKAAVYTQSEEWTPDRIDDLQTWIANLREESDVAIVVASRLPLPVSVSAPEVAEWLHLPYDTLNKPASPATHSASELPLLPCLKEAKWAGREHTVCRALWESGSSPYMPWLAVGYDHPHTFEFINTTRLPELNTTEKALEAEALANLRARPATWEPLDVDVKGRKLRILTCSGDYFAAEHVLDPAFMQQAQRTLKAPGLFVGVPRRGLLMAAAAGQDQQMIAAFGAAVAGQFSRGESAVISPMLFAMKDGAIIGILETVAEAIVPDAEPKGAPEDEREGDPNEPFVSAIVTSNDRGTEDVHLMAGGGDGERLATAIESGFMALLKEHMARPVFSGHIQIVVLGMTPPAARKPIPKLVEHLRGICNDISQDSTKRYRVTLTFQQDSLESPSNPPAATTPKPAPTAKVPVAADVTAKLLTSRSIWAGPLLWAMVLAVAAVTYVAFNWQSVQAYPDTIEFGSEQLSQATKWQRGGTSAAVYVPAGETMPGASLQVGVLISTEHATAHGLLSWIRDQARRSGEQRYHDSGTDSETCVVGLSSQPALRTYMALQMCKSDASRAACIESDRVLDGGEFGSCLNEVGCFEDVCNERWLDERDTLDAILTGFLPDASTAGADTQVRAH